MRLTMTIGPSVGVAAGPKPSQHRAAVSLSARHPSTSGFCEGRVASFVAACASATDGGRSTSLVGVGAAHARQGQRSSAADDRRRECVVGHRIHRDTPGYFVCQSPPLAPGFSCTSISPLG